MPRTSFPLSTLRNGKLVVSLKKGEVVIDFDANFLPMSGSFELTVFEAQAVVEALQLILVEAHRRGVKKW